MKSFVVQNWCEVRSLRQPRHPQAGRESGEMLRPPDRNPVFETGDTKRGIQLPQMFYGSPRLLSSAGERVTCGDDGNDSQEGRRVPERLLGPGGRHIKAPRKQMR